MPYKYIFFFFLFIHVLIPIGCASPTHTHTHTHTHGGGMQGEPSAPLPHPPCPPSLRGSEVTCEARWTGRVREGGQRPPLHPPHVCVCVCGKPHKIITRIQLKKYKTKILYFVPISHGNACVRDRSACPCRLTSFITCE